MINISKLVHYFEVSYNNTIENRILINSNFNSNVRSDNLIFKVIGINI